jgi:hypothetical protein
LWLFVIIRLEISKKKFYKIKIKIRGSIFFLVHEVGKLETKTNYEITPTVLGMEASKMSAKRIRTLKIYRMSLHSYKIKIFLQKVYMIIQQFALLLPSHHVCWNRVCQFMLLSLWIRQIRMGVAPLNLHLHVTICQLVVWSYFLQWVE